MRAGEGAGALTEEGRPGPRSRNVRLYSALILLAFCGTLVACDMHWTTWAVYGTRGWGSHVEEVLGTWEDNGLNTKPYGPVVVYSSIVGVVASLLAVVRGRCVRLGRTLQVLSALVGIGAISWLWAKYPQAIKTADSLVPFNLRAGPFLALCLLAFTLAARALYMWLLYGATGGAVEAQR